MYLFFYLCILFTHHKGCSLLPSVHANLLQDATCILRHLYINATQRHKSRRGTESAETQLDFILRALRGKTWLSWLLTCNIMLTGKATWKSVWLMEASSTQSLITFRALVFKHFISLSLPLQNPASGRAGQHELAKAPSCLPSASQSLYLYMFSQGILASPILPAGKVISNGWTVGGPVGNLTHYLFWSRHRKHFKCVPRSTKCEWGQCMFENMCMARPIRKPGLKELPVELSRKSCPCCRVKCAMTKLE